VFRRRGLRIVKLHPYRRTAEKKIQAGKKAANGRFSVGRENHPSM